MNSYLDIANSPAMWVACSAIIIVAFFQAMRLTMIAFRVGKSMGLSMQQMLTAFRTGFTTTLVPAIALLLGLALLIPKLGLPFPWMRLSVIGSVTFELIAAGAAATELGLVPLVLAFAIAFIKNDLPYSMVIPPMVVVSVIAARMMYKRKRVKGEGMIYIFFVPLWFPSSGGSSLLRTIEIYHHKGGVS